MFKKLFAPVIMTEGTPWKRILAFGYIAMAVLQCLSGVMCGAGDTVTPMWISVLMTVCLRVPLAYGLCWLTRSAEYPNGHKERLFISLLISWVVGTLITLTFYRRGKWKKRIVQRDND